jgi:hypothetical protein
MFSPPKSFLIQVFVDAGIGLCFAAALVLSLGPSLPRTARAFAWLSANHHAEWIMKASAVVLLSIASARLLAFHATPFIYFRF